MSCLLNMERGADCAPLPYVLRKIIIIQGELR